MFILYAMLLSISEGVPQSFTHLKRVHPTFYVDSSINCNEKVKRPKLPEEDTGYRGPPTDILCVFKLNGRPTLLTFNPGPSDDPWFTITDIKTDKRLLDTGGDTLYMTKKNTLYIAAQTNEMFKHRRKYTFDGKTFTEVKQPYYYVGQKTKVQRVDDKTTIAITLYQDKSKKKSVAVLPEGSEIEILLSDDPKWYLVRSSFGLVGWVEINEYAYKTPIGLRFNGD